MAININELRDRAATFGSDYLTDEEWVEVIDRLEAAEKSDGESIAMYRKARDERDELRAKLESAENERAIDEQRIADLMAELNRVGQENEELRARIEAMEKQEPVAWCATDETGTVIEALGMNQSRRFDTALYLAPGAKGG